MIKKLPFVLVATTALVCAAGVASPAEAARETHSVREAQSRAALAAHPWAGVWGTSFGSVGFRLMTSNEIDAAKTEAGASQLIKVMHCNGNADYYRGGYVSGSDSGKIIGCAVGKGTLAGRYRSNVDGHAGSFAIALKGSHAWSGIYRNDGSSIGKWKGTFSAHFTGDGCCNAPHTYPGRVDFAVNFYSHTRVLPPGVSATTPGNVSGHLEGRFNLPNGASPQGGVVAADTPILARFGTTQIQARVVDGSLQVLSPGKKLAVHLQVAISSESGHVGDCAPGTVGSIDFVYNAKAKGTNGLARADTLRIGPWQSACGSANHVITNRANKVPAHTRNSTWVSAWIGCTRNGGMAPKNCN